MVYVPLLWYLSSLTSKHASLPCPPPIVPPNGPVLPRASLPCTAPVPHRGHWLSPAQGAPPLPCPCPSQGPLSLCYPGGPSPALLLSLTGATGSVLPILPYVISKDVLRIYLSELISIICKNVCAIRGMVYLFSCECSVVQWGSSSSGALHLGWSGGLAT